MWSLELLGLVVLGAIAWEDLRWRAIHWWWLPALFGCLAVPALVRADPWYADVRANLLFLGIQFAVALALLMLKHRRWTNPVDTWVGTGDLLFLLVVAAVLPRWSFPLYYLSGLALSIVAYLALRRMRPTTAPSVPLAGLLALHLAGWWVLQRAADGTSWASFFTLHAHHG